MDANNMYEERDPLGEGKKPILVKKKVVTKEEVEKYRRKKYKYLY